MNFFTIKFGLDANQAALIDHIRATGGETIQVSDGIVAKSPLAKEELEKEVSTVSENITVIDLDPKLAANDPSVSKDTRVFLGLE